MEITQAQIQEMLREMGEKHAEAFLVDVQFVTKDEMQKLNRNHRQIDKPTDVLSFPTYSYQELKMQKSKIKTASQNAKPSNFEPILLGSLTLCESVVQEYANQEKTSFEKQLDWSIRHGLKHLLGYDHDETGEHWHPIVSQ